MPRLAVKENSSHFTSGRAAEVAKAGWLMRDATEIEVRAYFKEVPVAEGLSLLAQARKQIEIAAFELNQRIEEGSRVERCSGCGKTLEETGRSYWSMTTSELDPDTGTMMPRRYCTPMCIRVRNRKKMMPAGADAIAADGSEMGDVK